MPISRNPRLQRLILCRLPCDSLLSCRWYLLFTGIDIGTCDRCGGQIDNIHSTRRGSTRRGSDAMFRLCWSGQASALIGVSHSAPFIEILKVADVSIQRRSPSRFNSRTL